MIKEGDWIRLHEDAYQEYPGDRISSDMLLRVTSVDDYGIYIHPPFDGATYYYCHWEYDIVESEAK